MELAGIRPNDATQAERKELMEAGRFALGQKIDVTDARQLFSRGLSKPEAPYEILRIQAISDEIGERVEIQVANGTNKFTFAADGDIAKLAVIVPEKNIKAVS